MTVGNMPIFPHTEFPSIYFNGPFFFCQKYTMSFTDTFKFLSISLQKKCNSMRIWESCNSDEKISLPYLSFNFFIFDSQVVKDQWQSFGLNYAIR